MVIKNSPKTLQQDFLHSGQDGLVDGLHARKFHLKGAW